MIDPLVVHVGKFGLQLPENSGSYARHVFVDWADSGCKSFIVDIVEHVALLDQRLHGLVVVVGNFTDHVSCTCCELLFDDRLILGRNLVEEIEVDVDTTGSEEVASERHVLRDFCTSVRSISIHGTLETVDHTLLHCAECLTECQRGRRCTHGCECIDKELASGNSNLQPTKIVWGGDHFIGLQVSETEDVVKCENLDTVLLFELLKHTLHQIGLDHVLILVEGLVEHGTDKCIEIGNIVAKIRRIFDRDELRSPCNLLHTVFVCGELSLGIMLDDDGTIGALCNLVDHDIQRLGELFVRSEHVAHSQFKLVVPRVLGTLSHDRSNHETEQY